MNNQGVEQLLNDAIVEFDAIDVLIQQIDIMSPMCKYLTHYSLIKACGVIEYSFKSIVADYHNGCTKQLQTYIDKTVRESSINPSLENIHGLLKKFDDNWNVQFKNSLKRHPNYSRLTMSLNSLNSNRNLFAHGSNCNVSFGDIKHYFADAVEIIKCIDAAVV